MTIGDTSRFDFSRNSYLQHIRKIHHAIGSMGCLSIDLLNVACHSEFSEGMANATRLSRRPVRLDKGDDTRRGSEQGAEDTEGGEREGISSCALRKGGLSDGHKRT